MKKVTLILLTMGILILSGCIIQAPAHYPKPTSNSPGPKYPQKQAQNVLHVLTEFYTHASIELLSNRLPPGATLGNWGRDSKNRNVHFKWANGNRPGILKNELITKFRRMVKIKNHRGPHQLAGWYAHVCTDLAHFARNHKVNFGSPAANSTDFGVHERWALGPYNKPKPGVLEQQIIMRINKIFRRYGY